MIGKLKGRIDTTDEDSAIIDVGGVGYTVFLNTRTLSMLPGKGEAAELIIETHVREDHIHLFGFPDVAERDCFRLLVTVQGVGVKMAMAILSVFSPPQLAAAIAAKDVKSLTRVSGVGPKLAERMTTELKNKADKLFAGAAIIPHQGRQVQSVASRSQRQRRRGFSAGASGLRAVGRVPSGERCGGRGGRCRPDRYAHPRKPAKAGALKSYRAEIL